MEDVYLDGREEHFCPLVEPDVPESQAEPMEQLGVAAGLARLHLRLRLSDLVLVGLGNVSEHWLHQNDEAAGLHTGLHLEQVLVEVLAMQVAEAKDT